MPEGQTSAQLPHRVQRYTSGAKSAQSRSAGGRQPGSQRCQGLAARLASRCQARRLTAEIPASPEARTAGQTSAQARQLVQACISKSWRRL